MDFSRMAVPFSSRTLKSEIGFLFLQVREEFGHTATALISARRLSVVPTVAFALSVKVSSLQKAAATS